MVKKEDQDKEFQIVRGRKRKRSELDDGDESSSEDETETESESVSESESESESEKVLQKPPRKKLKKNLGKLPTLTQLRDGVNTIYSKLGPRLKECHYQAALQCYLEKFYKVRVAKEYPLKFKLFGMHIGYKRRVYTNDTKQDDDGKFYNYIDLFVSGSNGNIIIECKRDEVYKHNIKLPFFRKKIPGKYTPSEPTFDQIQRYHELLSENKISYKAFYLVNFPSKRRSRMEKHYVMKIPTLKD